MTPTNWELGLLDFFAILVPGSVVAWLALLSLPEGSANLLVPTMLAASGGEDAVAIWWWGAFGIASYVAGHIVFQASSGLDELYDVWRRRAHPKSKDSRFDRAAELAAQTTPGVVDGEYSSLKWCRVYLRLHAPELAGEVDRLEASQKLFRSLVVVSSLFIVRMIGPVGLAVSALLLLGYSAWNTLDSPKNKVRNGDVTASYRFGLDPLLVLLTAAAIVLLLYQLYRYWPAALAPLGSAVFGVASFARYCDQRWKMTELAYASALVVKSTGKDAKE